MGEKRRKNGSLITRGGLLSVFSIGIALLLYIRLIQAANVIGDEGMGYFAGAHELYMLLLLVTAYGIPRAMGKMIALRVNRGQYRNARKVWKTGLAFCLVLGIILGVILLLFGEIFSAQLLKLSYSRLAVWCFAVSLPVVLTAAAFSGFFQGMGSMMPTSVSKLVSAVIQLVMCFVSGHLVFSYGQKVAVVLNDSSYAAAFGAAGVALGVLAGEFFALAFLVLLFAAYYKSFHNQVLRDTTKSTETTQDIIRMLAVTMLPFLLLTLLLHCNVFVNQIIYNHTIMAAEQLTLATEYGIYYGKYYVLTGIPTALLAVMAENFAGIYKKMLARENYYHAKRFLAESIREVLMVSGISALVLIVLSGTFVELFYKGDSVTAAKLLRIGSVAIVFYGMAFLTGAALYCHGRLWTFVVISGVAFVAEALLFKVLLLTTGLGILAAAIVNLVFPLIILAGNILFLRKCQE